MIQAKSQLGAAAYILMQDRLSTGGSFILCDGNAHGFPISFASPGFASLHGRTQAECRGVKCGTLVAGPLNVTPERLEWTSKATGLSPDECKRAHDIMTNYTSDQCRLIMESPDEAVSFALVLNRRKNGDLFVNELIMMLHQHPAFGWSYFVGLQRDASSEVSMTTLLKAAQSRDTYEALCNSRQAQVHKRVAGLGAKASDAVQYLNEKACEAWCALMCDMLPASAKSTNLPSTLCSGQTGASISEESSEVSESVNTAVRLKQPLSESIHSEREFMARLIGVWNGRASASMGGYEQEVEFMDGGIVRFEVMGKSLDGSYTLNMKTEPAVLTLRLPTPPGKMVVSPQPPATNCIMKFDGENLVMCFPTLKQDGRAVQQEECPRTFAGPGLCVFHPASGLALDVKSEQRHSSKMSTVSTEFGAFSRDGKKPSVNGEPWWQKMTEQVPIPIVSALGAAALVAIFFVVTERRAMKT